MVITTKKFSNNRPPEEDDIVVELIKYSGKELKQEIHELITQTWEEGIPNKWKTGIIRPLHRKETKQTAIATEGSRY